MRHSIILLALTTACSSSPSSDAGTDAPMVDGGPRRVAAFAEIGATAEGIALRRTPEGTSVLYVGTRDDRIVRVAPDGSVDDFIAIDDPLGIAVRADGDLVVCAKAESGEPGLFAVTPSGAVSLLVGLDPDGEPFGLTNFVAIAPDDSIVFTDSMANRVYRASADGSELALVTDAITYPNGVAFSPDGGTLYVASWNGDTVYALSFDRTDGSYGAPEASIPGVPGVDGVVTTTSGALVLVTSVMGVVLATPGSSATQPIARAGTITLPANGVFGDATFGTSTLFVAALGETQVFRVLTDLEGTPLPAR